MCRVWEAKWQTCSSSAILPPSIRSTPSLASLIGGKATGPRLNKHAPQQDAHDPTTFVTGPSPLFSTLKSSTNQGVALPGLQKTPHFSKPDDMVPEVTNRVRATSETPVNKAAQFTKPPDIRTDAFKNPTLSNAAATSIIQSKPVPTTPVKSTSAPEVFVTPDSPRSTAPSPVIPSSKPQYTPPSEKRASTAIPIKSSSQTSPSPNLHRLSVTKMSSAFSQSSQQPRDLTPSLSRLQGRGFVASRVATVSNSPANELKSSNLAGPLPKGRGNVLDRWPIVTDSPSSSVSSLLESPSTPTKLGPRKSWPAERARESRQESLSSSNDSTNLSESFSSNSMTTSTSSLSTAVPDVKPESNLAPVFLPGLGVAFSRPGPLPQKSIPDNLAKKFEPSIRSSAIRKSSRFSFWLIINLYLL